MDYIHEYFLCDNCSNKDFVRIYNFSMRLHSVNFSEDLIYDEIVEELYRCTKCNKIFTEKQIKEDLAEFKRKHK